MEQNEVEQIELPYSENGTITLNMTIVDTNSSYEWDKNAEKITYTTSDKSVVAVDSNGKLTINGTGTATIDIKVAKTAYHKASVKTIPVTISEPIDTENIE